MPPAARITDMHTCPMVNPGPVPHVGGPIIKGQPNVLTVNMPQSRVSDQCICVGPPDIIVKGSMTVLCGGLPAARMGDSTAHGGVIVMGAPTVLIGNGSNGGGGGGSASAGMPGNVPLTAPNLQAKTSMAAYKEAKPFCEVCESGEDKAAKKQAVEKSAKATPAPKKKTSEDPYAVGSQLHGREIVAVKKGNDDPIVLIGTKMDGDDGVIAVADKLRAEGKNVEILEDGFLDGKKWEIDGEEWDVDSAWEDMTRGDKWRKLRESNGGRIPDENLPDTPMYKLNESWIKETDKSGATVLDIGNPTDSSSIFYKLEQGSVTWD